MHNQSFPLPIGAATLPCKMNDSDWVVTCRLKEYYECSMSWVVLTQCVYVSMYWVFVSWFVEGI